MKTVCLVLSLILLGGCVWGHRLEAEYLPELPGTVSSSAEGINNRGQVIGTCYVSGQGYRAVLWENGEVFQLPLSNWACWQGWEPTEEIESEAVDINNAGVVVGNFFRRFIDIPNTVAFTWAKTKGLTLILPLHGYTGIYASHITDDGTVYGTMEVFGSFGNRVYRPFNWTPKDGLLIGTQQGRVLESNPTGDAVGIVRWDSVDRNQAAIWREAGK